MNSRNNGNGHHSAPADLKDLVVEHTASEYSSEQNISLTAAQASQQLGTTARTVRRYITDGILLANGETLRLKARQVTSGRGPEWQIYLSDLNEFKGLRDRSATEGQTTNQLVRSTDESSTLAALSSSIQLISAELEQRSRALEDAQTTIERLAEESGRQKGLNEGLERERDTLLKQVEQLRSERDEWQQKAFELQGKMPKKVRLFPWGSE
jgi:chromosome segregation ATPase